MNNLIGYSISGGALSAGSAYTYFMAGNGIWIAASNNHMNVTIPIVEVNIRGLEPWETHIELNHGRVPQRLFDLALSVMLANPEIERYAGIIWDGQGYRLYVPEQESGEAKVKYQPAENVMVELHSHGAIGAGFSLIDDADEQGLKIYGVAGKYCSEISLRAGVYGYWAPVKVSEIFEGDLSVIDINNERVL